MVQTKLTIRVDVYTPQETQQAIDLVHLVYVCELEALEEGGAERNLAHSLIEIWASDSSSNIHNVLRDCFDLVRGGSPHTYICVKPGLAVQCFSYWYKTDGFPTSPVRHTLKNYFTFTQLQFSKSMKVGLANV